MYSCEFRDLGRIRYSDAFALQRELVSERKSGAIPDQLLIVEHPHVTPLGRNATGEYLLTGREQLERAGIELLETDRGGDVTYHGPGQIVGYPILDLKQWRRDVGHYVRALEQVLIHTLSTFGLTGVREPGMTGVWVDGAKVAAIGVHLSRWVTSHGFALNLDTDLSYFRHIVPCGLSRPVTSLRELGCTATRAEMVEAVTNNFGSVFEREMVEPILSVRTS